MLNLNRWAIFATAAELKSFSQAADRLNVSKPTVSKQINALEEILGTKLFLRTTRQLQLTENGEALYKHCAIIMREYNHAEDLLTYMLEKPCGELHINAPISYIQSALSELSIDFVKHYPDIKLNFHSHQMASEYFPSGVDIAIIINRLKDSNLCYRKLGDVTHTFCASPAYLARHGKPTTPEEIEQHNFIQANYAHISASSEWKVKLKGRDQPLNLSGNISVDESLSVKKLVLDGGGITVLPSFIIEQEIQQGTLIELLPDHVINSAPVYAVFPEKKYMPPKVRAYLDYLIDYFANNNLLTSISDR